MPRIPTRFTDDTDDAATPQGRDPGADSDARPSGAGFTTNRRTLLEAVGSGALLGALGSQSAGAVGASFGDGVNLQPSYFCSGDQALGWDLLNQFPDVETVRIEIEPFSFDEVVTTVDDAKRWIDEAGANGKNVVATYHHYPDNGSADPAALQNAADFWVEHYATLSADTSFTVNMMNEWGNHEVTASDYASAYDDAIGTVRDGTSYTGPIVCDAPGWGQGTYRLADAVEAIADENLILSSHVYPSAYSATQGRTMQPSDLDVLDATGYPCMIGEFGNYADTMSADWSAIIDYAKQLGWPVIGWAWNGDGSAEPMNMADPYWGDDCTATSYTTTDYFSVVYDKLGDTGTDDTTAPSAPSGLSVDSIASTTVSVSWSTASDSGGSGLDHYDVSVDESVDHTVPAGTTSTTISGLSPATTYDVGVSAVDGAGNESATTTISATTAEGDGTDLLAEVDPSTTTADVGERITFRVTDTSGSGQWLQSLDWTFGDGTTATGWWNAHSYDSSGTYTVALTATDDEGDTTTHEVSITVGSGTDDSTAPGVPSNLSVTDTTSSSVEVGWDASSDDDGGTGLDHYNLYVDGQLDHEVGAGTTSATASGLSADTIYEIGVSAVDGAGNESARATVTATTGGGGDATAPTAPSNLSVSSTTATSFDIDWDASTDSGGSGLDGYVVYVDGSQDQTVAAGTTSASVTGLSAGTSYELGISAVDGAGNESATTTVSATTAASEDATAPEAPSNLASTGSTSASVAIEWDASTDEGGSGLDHYDVSLDGSQDHTVAAGTTSTTVTGLSPDTTYEIGVSAVDGAGNESATTTVAVTTPPGDPVASLLVNEYDGSPAWPGQNDLGNWNGAGSFENGDGEVVSGELVLEYDDAGWAQERIDRDVSDYTDLVFVIRGASGGEGAHFAISLGGATNTFADVADSAVTTTSSEVRIDMQAAGIDRTTPAELQLDFWQGGAGASTIYVEEIRFE